MMRSTLGVALVMGVMVGAWAGPAMGQPASTSKPATKAKGRKDAVVNATVDAKASAAALEDLKTWLKKPAAQRTGSNSAEKQAFASVPLTKADAAAALDLLWKDEVAGWKDPKSDHAKEWEAKVIKLGDKEMKFDYKIFGEKPKDGRSLIISMHGGGNAPAKLNDEQWENQKRLYRPSEAVYLAPRAPTNTWMLWHESHIDPMFERIIQDAIAFEDVNPDRVYITGYSAGGDGTFQLAPRMADRWAAAGMMAGHPGDAKPDGLRNLPFALHVGALDSAYKRNELGKEWGDMLDKLQADDPKGYEHQVQVHAGKPHWMDGEEAPAIEWMLQHTRKAAPDKVIWVQDDVTHGQMYWLAVPKAEEKERVRVEASVKDQVVTIASVTGGELKHLIVLLDDRLVDMDKPVKIVMDGKTLYEGTPGRTIGAMAEGLKNRADPKLAYMARVQVTVGK